MKTVNKQTQSCCMPLLKESQVHWGFCFWSLYIDPGYLALFCSVSAIRLADCSISSHTQPPSPLQHGCLAVLSCVLSCLPLGSGDIRFEFFSLCLGCLAVFVVVIYVSHCLAAAWPCSSACFFTGVCHVILLPLTSHTSGLSSHWWSLWCWLLSLIWIILVVTSLPVNNHLNVGDDLWLTLSLILFLMQWPWPGFVLDALTLSMSQILWPHLLVQDALPRLFVLDALTRLYPRSSCCQPPFPSHKHLLATVTLFGLLYFLVHLFTVFNCNKLKL